MFSDRWDWTGRSRSAASLPKKAISSSVQEGVNRGVTMGLTYRKSPHSSSHRRVSVMDSSVVSWRLGAPLRSMFTLPTYPVTPAFSSSSMRIRVAWR